MTTSALLIVLSSCSMYSFPLKFSGFTGLDRAWLKVLMNCGILSSILCSSVPCLVVRGVYLYFGLSISVVISLSISMLSWSISIIFSPESVISFFISLWGLGVYIS